jgi:hypothetical protein
MTNIVPSYCLLAIAIACLLMYVMVKYGEQQRVMKKSDADPRWLQASRKSALFVGSSLMTFSAAATWTTGEISPYVVLVLMVSVAMILTLNALSQHRRTPPEDRGGGGIEEVSWLGVKSAGSFGYYLAQEDIERLGVDISRLHRGQRLTHLQLEALFNHLKIDPGPAVIPADPVVIHTDKFRPRKAEEK